MDESFQIRARRRLNGGRETAPLDHDVLRATLAAQQSTSPTAVAQARAEKAVHPREGDPLTELLLGGADWKEAASGQEGCFNRAESERRRNGT